MIKRKATSKKSLERALRATGHKQFKVKTEKKSTKTKVGTYKVYLKK